MAPPRGSAAYKKNDGTLAISKDSLSVAWTPVAPPGSKPALTLPVSTITSKDETTDIQTLHSLRQLQISNRRPRVVPR